MVDSICPWKWEIPSPQLEFLTGMPTRVRVGTWKLGGTATTLTSEFNMAAQHINCSETVVMYNLLTLLFIYFSTNSVAHTVLSMLYLCTLELSVQIPFFLCVCFLKEQAQQ